MTAEIEGAVAKSCRPFLWRVAFQSLRRSDSSGTSSLPGVSPIWENAAMSYLLVFFGGGLGASLRHLVNVTCARALGTAFPWGTFIINITGSTVMGLIAGYLAFKGEASQPWRLFLMTGILGGYTTFSAYSLDAALLYERGELASAALYVVGSVVLSIAGLFAGLALVRQFS
jgi:CrcB protein